MRLFSIIALNKQNHYLIQIGLALSVGLLLGISTIMLSPLWILAGLAILGLGLVVIKRPEIGLLGYLCITSTIIDQGILPRIPIGVGRLMLTDIILLSLFGLVLVRALVEQDFHFVRTPLDIPLLIFVGISILSTIIAIFRSTLTLNESLGDIRIVMSYLTFFVVTNLVRVNQQLHTLFKGLYLLAAIISLAMITQLILGNSLNILPGRVEILGTEGVRFLGVTRIIPPGESLVFVIFIMMTVKLAMNRFNFLQSWFILLWVLTGLGVVLTFKRHLWVVTLLILFLLAFLGRSKVWSKMIGGMLTFGLVLIILLSIILSSPGSEAAKFVFGVVERLATLTSPQTFVDPNSSLRWRDFEYRYAMPQISSHPLIGLGLGAIYRPFVVGKDWEGYDGRRFIHNGHLSIIVKSGMLGYLSFLVFSMIALVRGFRFWRRIPYSQFQSAFLGFTLAYLGILIGSIISPMIITAWWTPVIGIILGINEVILSKVVTKNMEVSMP